MTINLGVIILAAGMGKRMRSSKAKVLHEIDGKPMILHVLETASRIAGDDIVVVVGHQADEVKKKILQSYSPLYALQKEQLGTGHAVLCALPVLPAHIQRTLILYGDVPLLTAETIQNLIGFHEKKKCDITTLAVESPRPRGYGRALLDAKGMIRKIVEEADATEEEKKIRLINTGIYCVEKGFLMEAAPKLKPENAQNEYYLTDLIEIAYRNQRISRPFISKNFEETNGINSMEDLSAAEADLKKKKTKIS
ncbi:conserved hypothetical protein [Candidatus Desulfarcum epimagneticum]|uniref:MobA-like NTP transferase domain-containing protein n=1 Tax=uncultured Desulfobacteraceae bacterium TaxID=218296 RepID=A0A484HJ11_9BACT|nr:conserved hypothetical protein [uncultured Desulfobacteraceae bacterium]